MRAKWKGVFEDKKNLETLKVLNRGLTITLAFLNKRVLVYNGLRFISIVVKESMLGHKFGQFVLTKSLGVGIHTKKKK
jgi:ribosomal protein S19